MASSSRMDIWSKYRWAAYPVLLLALIVFPFSVREAALAWQDYALAHQQWDNARAQNGRLAQLRTEMQAFEAYEGNVRELMQSAKAGRLAPADWEERQVNVQRRELSRREAAGFLSGAGRGTGYFFIPQRFDLRTVQKGNDLFYYREGDINRLRLTLKGVYLARGQN